MITLSAPAADSTSRVELWPAGVPGGPPAHTPEQIDTSGGWTRSSNIEVPYFTVHLAPATEKPAPAIVVVPGGAYGIIAFEHEGVDVATWLNARGVSAFVLRYRHCRDRHPAPLRDVLRAIRLVRSGASDYGVDPSRIGVLGFSAGGHLASCAATMFDDPEGRGGDALDAVSARPDFAVLIYPVITLLEPYTHTGSRDNLLGPDAPVELLTHLSTDRRVTPRTPPVFLLHAADDGAVPVENARLFYQAALDSGVPIELHIFEKGGHGFGIRPNVGAVAIWPDLVLGWMRDRGIVKMN